MYSTVPTALVLVGIVQVEEVALLGRMSELTLASVMMSRRR